MIVLNLKTSAKNVFLASIFFLACLLSAFTSHAQEPLSPTGDYATDKANGLLNHQNRSLPFDGEYPRVIVSTEDENRTWDWDDHDHDDDDHDDDDHDDDDHDDDDHDDDDHDDHDDDDHDDDDHDDDDHDDDDHDDDDHDHDDGDQDGDNDGDNDDDSDGDNDGDNDDDSDGDNVSSCFIEHNPETWTELPSNDDGSSPMLEIPFEFEMFGTSYSSLYVNNNGNITFDAPEGEYTASSFPMNLPMVAPFWGDVDTRFNNDGEVWYYVSEHYLIATYVDVQVYASGSYPGLRNTFQVIISDGNDDILEGSNNVGFFYRDMDWTTGNASDGNNGFGGAPAMVGVNSGNAEDFVLIGEFGQDHSNHDGPGGNMDGVHWLDNNCLQFKVSENENLAPQLVSLNNPTTICAEDGGEVIFQFSGPEQDQIVNVEVDDNGNGGLTITNNTEGTTSNTTLTFSGLNPGEYVYTITASDNGSPAAETEIEFTLIVEQCCFPNIEITCPNDAAVECGMSTDPMNTGQPTMTFDDCWTEDIVLSNNDVVMSTDNCSTIIARTWIASSGGETEMCTQMITVQDSTAPTFVTVAEDLTLECDEAIPTPFATATDNCDAEVTIDVSSETTDGSCANEYTMVRTYTATDICGNSQTATQTITVEDTTAPNFTNLPEDLTVQCLEDVPAQAEVIAEDACSMEVDVDTFASETGNVISSCTAQSAVGPNGTWALWLPQFEEEGLSNTDSFVSESLTFEQYADGTARLFGTVVNDENPDQGFIINTWYQNGMDWDEWSNQDFPTSYKDDLGFGTIDNRFEDWMYYITVAGFSTLTGTGDLDGTVLYLTHEPSNLFFGMQCGLAANDRNENFGMSSWFSYSGISNGEDVNGVGDFNIDKECTPNNEQNCPSNTEISYFWRAEDDCGNTTMASQVITVFDDIAPEFTAVPEDITVECDEPAVPVFEDFETSDNCEGDVTVAYLGEVSNIVDCTTTLTRTWSATDLCGNRKDHVQTITIVDTTAPEVTFVPADLTVECDEEIPVVLAEGVDNCQDVVEVTYEDTITEGDCPQEYTITRTFFLNDGCDNVSTAIQSISVVDTTAPVFDPYDYYFGLECDMFDTLEPLTAADNCGEVSIELNETINSGGCLGVLHRVFTATDECGNQTVAEQFITILDTTAPVIENPADATVECDNVPEAPGAEGINIFDNCGNDVEVTFDETITAGSCESEYTITWTWTATDVCWNESTATTTITVQDTTAPVFTQELENVSVECSDDLPEVVFPTATDNCDVEVSVELTEDIVPGACPQEYTLNRIFRAFDNCGNEAMQVQTITVQDTTAPVFGNSPDETFECSDEITVTLPSATDNCGEVTVTYTDGEQIPVECANEYSFERTYTAVDECGNESSISNMIFVVDTTAPVFAAYDVEIDMPCDNIMPTTLEATDNCGDVEITFVDTPVSGGCAGRIIRDYTAVDACGNEATAQQIITLVDEVAPVWTLFPEDVTVECDMVPSNDTISVAFEDNCDDELDLVYNGEEIIEGSCEDNYTIVRTWTITDDCDNATESVWTITVQDTTAPEFTQVAEDVTVECDQDLLVPFSTATDNCDAEVEIIVTSQMIEGECANEYTMVRTYTAIDNCGNVATATQTISVVDTTAPVIAYQGGELTLECDQTVDLPEVTATDNCGEATVSMEMSMDNGQCENERFEIYTWTATDACGNESESVSLSVSYVDTTAPVFAAYDVEIDMPCDDITNTTVSATDNCGDVEITFVDTPVSGGCAGRIIRDFTAVDACGNEATTQQIITLVDEVAPVWTLFPADVTVECDNVPSNDGIEVAFEDNCDDELDLVYNGEEIIEGSCEDSYTIVRTWTITDDCDNATQAVWTITVQDTTAPEFTFIPEDVTVECGTDLTTLALPEINDACDSDPEMEMIEVITEGDCPQEYVLQRMYRAFDNCGNSAMFVHTITVVDTTAPEFTSVPDSNDLSCEDAIPSDVAMATDNCGDATVSMEETIIDGDCPQSYTIVRTWTATDACGNTSTATTQYFIFDDVAPVFVTLPSDISVECASDVPAMEAPEATDNCGGANVICFTETLEEDECGNYSAIVTCVATDECGNSSVVSYTIDVMDVTAPTLMNTPVNLVLDCEDDVPAAAAADVTAMDNCDNDVTVNFTEELFGDVPAEGSIADCNLSTPQAFNEDGTVCTGDEPWSLLLFDFDNADKVFYSTIEANFVEYPDGTATLTGSVVRNDDPSRGWNINVEFADGMDWSMWSTQGFPTSFKDDCDLAGDNYLDWTYYIMQAGASLTGWGANEGSTLMLNHAPSSLYYGYQVGQAADNVNVNYGSGGWFTYSGSYNGQDVTGSGDFAFEHDCCPDYSIERTWCAVDCSGNETCYTQMISFDDLGIDPPIVTPIGADEAQTSKGDFQITKVSPNPSVERTNVEFVTKVNTRVIMEVYDLSGRVVGTLYDGNVFAGETYRTTFNTSQLESGLYTIRLASTTSADYQKLAVQK